MSNLLRPWGAAACAVVASLACGGPVPPTFYYVLNLPAPAPAANRLDHTAVLMPVRANRVVGQGRIVYRESREQVGFYEYHRWAEDPEDTVSAALARELMARGTFASVSAFDGRTKADFVIRGELGRLEEIDYDGPVRVKAEVSLELVNASTGRVTWSGIASRTENVPASDMRSVVSVMSAAVDATIKQLVGELDEHLRRAG